MKQALRIASCLFLMMVAAPGLMWGQANATGTITGTVTDQSGGVVVGAEVTITDVATKSTQTQRTNQVGHFIFANLDPETYDVSVVKSGFRRLRVPAQTVMIGKTITLTLALEVGVSTQTVEVTAAPGAELQTVTSTMSSTMSNDTMLNLPSINRDVSTLLNYQATAAPTFHGAEGDVTGGSIAGATPDQNTFMLDGSNNTSGLEGDNGYINGFSGDQRGVVPTPIESIAEVTVNTNNMTADFNSSVGGEMMAVTKRGHDAFHGAGYDFFQGDWLNTNNWSNNFTGVPKPKTHQNRFGFDVGGPMLPKMAGGKTYFFFNFEGQVYPFNQAGQFTRTVPSAQLTQGVIQIKTAEGIQSFNLAPSAIASLNVCGAAGGELCDPRKIGMSSTVSTMWSKYIPAPNSTNTNGDKLNTFAYRGNLTLPLKNDIMIGRIDHDFGSKMRFYARYSWFKQNTPGTNEVDYGGLLPGDTKGTFASAASNNNQPATLVLGLDSTLSPTLTNSFHFGYTRNEWNWIREGVAPQISGAAGAVEIDGESTNALIPVNIDTQDSRNRAWYEHNYDYREELSWLHGNHMLQFGGDVLHEWWHFNRYDNVVGGLTNLVYELDDGAVQYTSDFEPQPCGGTVTTGCLDPSAAGSTTLNASQLGTWKEFYADLLGIANQSSIVATRSGANLALNPLGTPAASFVYVDSPSLYFSDAWKIKPNITLNFGLNYGVQLPPYDVNGRQDTLVDANDNPITNANYLAQRQAFASNGQVYFPTVGFSPVGAVGMKYPFSPYYGELAPRVSVAWSPTSEIGWVNKLLGSKSTVIRGGYGRFYARDFGINIISNPILGDGFLQPVACKGPTMAGTCVGVGVATPATIFRMGSNADGLNVPLPTIAATLSSPVIPPAGTSQVSSLDSQYRPAVSDQFDFSIQRHIKGDMIVEVGYLGVSGHHLYNESDMNSIPWMMKLGGQTFAQAYAAVWTQLNAGTTPAKVTAQPFFESALSGTGLCSQYNNCTAYVATYQGSNITSENVTGIAEAMDSKWNFGHMMYSTTQAGYEEMVSSTGLSDYSAFIVKLSKHAAHGLTFNMNATYGRSLGTLGLAQTYTEDTADNAFNPRANWTPQPWDRKFAMNWLGTYHLPFGPGQRFSNPNPVLSRLMGGWSVSPLLSWASGLPVEFYTGGDEMGAGEYENGASAVPVGINTATLTNSQHHLVVNDPANGQGGNPNSVGVNGNAYNGGAGENMFANPISVYNSFRPFVLGIDGAPSPDGQLRGPVHWVLDLGITKDTKIHENVGFTVYCQMINAFNHTNWNAPFLDLQDAPDFGTMTGGYGSIGNYGRVIELGARISF